MMFGLNLKLIGVLGLASIVAVAGAYGAGYWRGHGAGKELAELRCDKRVQRIEDAVAAANAEIRKEDERRRREVAELIAARAAEARRHAEQELEAQKRIEDYEHELEGRDACTLGPDDIGRLR